jgi:hypothetical protein
LIYKGVFLPYWLGVERVGLCVHALGKLIMAEKEQKKVEFPAEAFISICLRCVFDESNARQEDQKECGCTIPEM